MPLKSTLVARLCNGSLNVAVRRVKRDNHELCNILLYYCVIKACVHLAAGNLAIMRHGCCS